MKKVVTESSKVRALTSNLAKCKINSTIPSDHRQQIPKAGSFEVCGRQVQSGQERLTCQNIFVEFKVPDLQCPTCPPHHHSTQLIETHRKVRSIHIFISTFKTFIQLSSHNLLQMMETNLNFVTLNLTHESLLGNFRPSLPGLVVSCRIGAGGECLYRLIIHSNP